MEMMDADDEDQQKKIAEMIRATPGPAECTKRVAAVAPLTDEQLEDMLE